MKKVIYIFLIFFVAKLSAQSQAFKSGSKYGIKQGDKTLIEPLYDTIFNFDVTNKVCLACFKLKNANANRFIKLNTLTFACNYLNADKKILIVKTETGDTTSVFSLSKTSLKEMYDDKHYFTVTHKNKKYLLDKNFNQLTFKGYHTISLSSNPNFLVVEKKQESSQIYTGLINFKEEKIIDFNYSSIKVNTSDSLIIACSSGVNLNADDDVFNYEGKKIYSFKRHVDMATKTFIIHKIFEPSEYYITYNIITKEETVLNVLDVKNYSTNEILVKIKNDWFIYNLISKEKKLMSR